MGKPETVTDGEIAVPGYTELPGNQRQGWRIDVMHEGCCQKLVKDISRDVFEPEVFTWFDMFEIIYKSGFPGPCQCVTLAWIASHFSKILF